MARTRWLDPKAVAIGDMMHCIIQGTLIPLLISFITSSDLRNDKILFKLYVLFVNGLALTQTVVHLFDTLDFFDSRTPASRPAILVLNPVLNVTLSASAQLFFIFRCWRIYKERVLYVLPLLVLWLTALVPGLFVGYYFLASTKRNTLKPASITMGFWIFSSFALELCVTTTTMIYLFRTRTGLPEHNGVFKTVWQVTWVSAALPPILMVVIIINGFILNTLTHPVTAITVDMTGKAYALSLMITIVGRGYIRAQLDGANRKSGLAPALTVIDDVPTVAVIHEESSAFELEPRGPATTNGAESDCEVAYPHDAIQTNYERLREHLYPSNSTSEMTASLHDKLLHYKIPSKVGRT